MCSSDLGDRYPLLAEIVSQTAVDDITGPSEVIAQPTSQTPFPPAGSPPAASDGQAAASAVSPITVDTAPEDQPDPPAHLTQEHIEAAATELVGGRLVFFFGNAVHTDQIDGNGFYYEICRQGGIEWPRRDRALAAEYIAELNRDHLSAIVRDLIHAHFTQPSLAHRFVATLPAKLEELGRDPNVMIMTTNYDTMTEAAFAAAQEPYHLFMYNADGLYAGRFLHRRPDGREFAIRTPAAIRKALDAPAIVKLNGGIDPLERFPATFAVASSDFEQLAVRLPDVLPQIVWNALKTRSLLFLGHGLGEPDVKSLLRRRKRDHAPDSWAVQRSPADSWFWQANGVKLIDAEVDVYLARLKSVLNTATPPAP